MAGADRGTTFLPNFCDTPTVMSVMVLAELFAIVLALAIPVTLDSRWAELGLLSLFIQWVVLSCTALLCLLRRQLARLGNIVAGGLAYLMILVVIAFFSELAHWLMVRAGTWSPAGHDTFILRNLGIGAVVAAVALRWFYLQAELRLRDRAEANARLEALQARIRPHFLFNSLNTVAALTRRDPPQAEEVVHDIADLFRATLGEARRLVPLAEELELVRSYLRIEGLRLGDRLRVAWTLEVPPGDWRIPPLSLQPLVENAIYHGIEPRLEGGTVQVGGGLQEGRLRLEVRNPLPQEGPVVRDGNRMAVDNVRARLEALYGDAAQLESLIVEEDYLVRLWLPLHVEEAV